MDFIKKTLWPLIFIGAGLIFLIFGLVSGQTGLFNLGAAIFLIAGIISLLSTLDVLTKTIRMVVLAVLILISLGLTWLDYKAIKDPLDFQKERDYRYQYVIQNLKDIRQIQTNYKSVYGEYCADMDSLMFFVKYDSIPVVKSTGNVPDTLTLAQAIELEIVQLDTSFAPASETIFSEKYMQDRKLPLHIDSLMYVPFTRSIFELDAGFIERSKVEVAVFECKDSKPFDPSKVLAVGSLTDPTTSGNWGE